MSFKKNLFLLISLIILLFFFPYCRKRDRLNYLPPQIYMAGEEDNKMIMWKKQDCYNIQLDLSNQVLSLNVPEVEDSFSEYGKKETPIYPVLKDITKYRPFISASIISAKAKQFDDGLYAAIEIATQEGINDFEGKKSFLVNIYKALNELKATNEVNEAKAFILAASTIGGQNLNGKEEITKLSEQIKENFLEDSLCEKPVSFYTWNNTLSQIFQQDRLLQTNPSEASMIPLVQAIVNSNEVNSYVKYLQLMEKLSNPFPEDFKTLMTVINKDHFSEKDKITFFPPSRSYETELIKKIFPEDNVMDENFNLSEKLIKEIKTGNIKLIPAKDSGWYDYQTYSLEPLVLPDKFPEAQKIEFSKSYKKELLELFKSLLSLMRETHVKQLEKFPMTMGCEEREATPKPVIEICPELSIEPLVTYYLRRARSYNFIHGVLIDILGKENLQEIHRLTPAGTVEKNLDEELTYIEALFYGTACTSALQIGSKLEINYSPSVEKEMAIKTAGEWINNLDKDSDILQDNRMMIPVFYDSQRDKIKAWVFLGYEAKTLTVNFKSKPFVKVFDKYGRELRETDVEIVYRGNEKYLIYPVFAEIYVNEIFNREEFRKICDKYETRSEILEALQNL